MRKVIIFYASYGGGHLSAAKSIQKYITENYENVETQMIDCMKYVNRPIEKMTTGAYREMAKKAPKLWGKVYEGSQKGLLSLSIHQSFHSGSFQESHFRTNRE